MTEIFFYLNEGEEFGTSVSLGTDATLIVGAPAADTTIGPSGRVYVFTWSLDATCWADPLSYFPSEAIARSYWGVFVAAGCHGTFVVGATSEETSNQGKLFYDTLSLN